MLPLKDLYHLSQINKQFYKLATPFLYQYFDATWRPGPYPLQRVDLLNVFASTEKAVYIRHITIGPEYFLEGDDIVTYMARLESLVTADSDKLRHIVSVDLVYPVHVPEGWPEPMMVKPLHTWMSKCNLMAIQQ